MTSAIVYNTVDVDFPVAGQDNDSQGFRDNFTVIRDGLATAASEITDLQTNTAKLNADNDFGANVVSNLQLNKVYGTVNRFEDSNSATSVSYNEGNLQTITIVGARTVTFTNWPDTDLVANIKLHLNNATATPYTVTFATAASGVFKTVSGEFTMVSTTPTKSIPANTEIVVEAWTHDGGDTVFLKLIGGFV